MSTLQSILRYINEDYAPPTIRLILVSQNGVLLNKIVPKKSTLHDILIQEGLKEENNYMLFGKPVNLEQKIIDLIPKNYTNLSNIELIIEDKNILLEQEKVYYETILKPFDNPFKVLIFTPNEFNVSVKSYSNKTIEKLKLNKFSTKLSSYCNTPENLYLSGGTGDDYSSLNSGNKHFWKISSIKTNIQKLNDLPINKQYHSMIFIPKRYIYFIGGNNKNTFFYDLFFFTFTSWANMNMQVKNPFLILVNNIFIYSFGALDINNTGNNLIFERTNLKSSNPKWELKNLKNQVLPLKNFGGTGVSDEIYFLGGRTNRGEKMYKFNVTTENIEKCKQENTKLRPLDKNFYDLNEFNSVMIPDCQMNKDIQIIIFNKIRKKHRKVLFEKNMEEIVNNEYLKHSNLDNSLIKDNNQMKIIWKEYKNNYVAVNDLPENMLVLPLAEELKQGNIVFKNNKNIELKENKDEIIQNNIYNNNIISNGEKLMNNKITEENNKENLDLNVLNLNKNEENKNNDDLIKNDNEKNNINENNNVLLNDIIAPTSNNNSIKQILNKGINDNINLKTNIIDIDSNKNENLKNQIKSNDIDKDEKIINPTIYNKENKEINNENVKDNKNITQSQSLYKKKTIIKPDSKGQIIIQCDEHEKSQNKENLNKNNNNAENINDNNTFNIEYNNEIITGDNQGMMLVDIISSNSEINRDKNNKGLNNRFIVNVPKSKIEKKIKQPDENSNEVKYETNKKNNNNNVNEKINNLQINENSELNNESEKNKKNLPKEIIEIKNKNDVQKDFDINNKKLEGESIEAEITGKEDEHKIKEKIINIKENNNKEKIKNIKEDFEDDNKDEDSEILLIDKIVYNEKEINDLKNKEELSKQKNIEEEVITGIIKGIPKTKKIKDDKKTKDEKENNIEKIEEKNKNIPQTINSILKGNIDDDIKLNKINPIEIKYEIKEENIDNNMCDKNADKNEIKNLNHENIEINLNNENMNPKESNDEIENEIHLPNNTFKEVIPGIKLKVNNESNINDINPKFDITEVEKPEIKNSIDINEKSNKNQIPQIENSLKIKDSDLKVEPTIKNKEINESQNKEEIFKGKIPGIKKNNNLSRNVPIEENKKIQLKLKSIEIESLNNISENKETNKDLNNEKENKNFESITGSIKGSKNLVENGDKKDKEKQNITKGKNFTNEPEIIIKGIIEGTKSTPPNLKSIFEGNINEQIILNNNKQLKPLEYVITEDDIPEYLKKKEGLKLSEENIKVENIKIENPELKTGNINNIEVNINKKEIKLPGLDSLNDNIKDDFDIKMELNKENIKNPEIKLQENSENIKVTNPIENIEVNFPTINNDLKEPSLEEENLQQNDVEEQKIEGVLEGDIPKLKYKNNINVSENKDIIPNININNQNSHELNIETKIPSIEGNIKINDSKEKIPSISEYLKEKNSNLNEEMIEGIIPGMKKEIKPEMKIDISNKDLKSNEDNKNIKLSENNKNNDLNKEKESKIYESITGSIIGTPRMKNIVEYGSTKGYKRPNIKKGKDFIHNPEIIIEGTIGGKKKIPINNKIELNKSNVKYPEIKLEDYLESLILSTGNNIGKDEFKNSIPKNNSLKSSNLEVKNIDNKNHKGEMEIKIMNESKIESIKGMIPGNKNYRSIKTEVNKERGKINEPNIGGNINVNISNSNKEKNKDKTSDITKSHNVNINQPNIEEIKEKDKKSIKSTQIKLSKDKEMKIYESITGSIIGTPRMKNIVEYGSTKGYKRPNIKKGKDFIHNPEIIIEGTIGGKKKIP